MIVLDFSWLMRTYQSATSHSSIDKYFIGKDFIKIKYKEGQTYKYTSQKVGKEHIEVMKKLARKGRGLNRYIIKKAKFLFI